MTSEDREKRIEAAGRAFRHGGWLGRSEIVDMLDAADRAVPGITVQLTEGEIWSLLTQYKDRDLSTADRKLAEAYKDATGKEALGPVRVEKMRPDQSPSSSPEAKS